MSPLCADTLFVLLGLGWSVTRGVLHHDQHHLLRDFSLAVKLAAALFHQYDWCSLPLMNAHGAVTSFIGRNLFAGSQCDLQ